MLTIKDFNRITFLHHRGIVPPAPAKEGETVVEKRFVCTANVNNPRLKSRACGNTSL